MSHDSKLNVPSDNSVQTAIKETHDTAVGNDGAFVVLGVSGNQLSVIQSGKEGASTALAELPADQARFILLRRDLKVELAKTSKFVFISWVPEGLKPMAKAALSVQKPEVQKLAKPYNLEISASTVQELKDEVIADQLENVSGVKKHQTESAATVRPSSQSVSAPKTDRAVSPRQSTAESKFAGFKPAVEVAVTCDNEEEFKAALLALRNSKASSPGWIAARYAKKDTLHFIGTDLESLTNLPTLLTSGEIVFALVRTTSNDGKATTAKFHFVNWVGGDIKPMTKAEAATRLGQVVKYFGPSAAVLNHTDASKYGDEKTFH